MSASRSKYHQCACIGYNNEHSPGHHHLGLHDLIKQQQGIGLCIPVAAWIKSHVIAWHVKRKSLQELVQGPGIDHLSA